MAGSDRTLRRMVAKLGTLPPEDYEAILDNLDERQKSRVHALLVELEGRPTLAAVPEPPRFDVKAMPAGLSPWLLERLGVPVEDGAALPAAGAMTDHAASALRACAATLDPVPSEPQHGTSLAGRLRSRLGIGLDSRMMST